ncbi:hypothetical protein SAMN05421641_11744 [Paracoccus thiocyanatus]|uniref:Uncharacterized protein n=1 Tax=Paracoccus thiocyanatus TaxID=34006 RepID=A0A1N6WLK5_9RHOB|nr:hypothetical protein SAMN05421641_11744 [Paracoccus thiocyanatus]
MSKQFASVLVAPEDYAKVSALSLPVSLIVAQASSDTVEFSDGRGQALPLDQVALRAIGRLPLSSGGKAHLAQLAKLWQSKLDADAPAEIPLEMVDTADSRAKVLEWLVAELTKAQQQGAQRSTRFMRELGLLRQQHEEIQASFQNLEQFVYRHGPQHRKLETTLSPVAGQLPITLRNGSRLVERLPGSSVGLSDIAIQIANETPPAEGVLNVSLQSPDTSETLAIWQVPAARLTQGWLRFSLDRALGPDTISLTLSLSYQGTETIRLASAVQHPEPRFHPDLDGQPVETLPALQIWRWIAGARAPVPANAVIQVGGKNRLRRVERDSLATAINLETLHDTLPMFQSGDALLVHVLPDLTACGVLAGLALPGMRQVFASILTRHPEAPPVEYQLALLPQDQRPHLPGRLPAFDPALASGWIRLQPEEEGQAHVLPPGPLDGPHDIYLMTRLPQGHSSNHYGWSTFSNICLQF